MSNADTPYLPQSPDLEQERVLTEELLRAQRAGEATAIMRLRANRPRFAQLDASGVKLSDAQWVIAQRVRLSKLADLASAHFAWTSGMVSLNEESETASVCGDSHDVAFS